MAAPDRWEHGSELHWQPFPAGAAPANHPWKLAGAYHGSGRDSLRALLEHGHRERGWRRLWIPSYFCQEVVSALLDGPLSVATYPDRPDHPPPGHLTGLSRGDAVLVVNYFGLRDRGLNADGLPAGVDVIEDHTHNPWSQWAVNSGADFCVASLRKTLPLADGGVTWSPRGHALSEPVPITPERAGAAAQKTAAMLLKGLYLAGHAVEKASFRELSIAGEHAIASGAVSGMSPLTRALVDVLPAHTWRSIRRANHGWLTARLSNLKRVEMLHSPALGAESCAFSLILRFDSSKLCSAVRRRLIETHVYPAVLWSLAEPVIDGVGDAERELAQRLLSLHCDYRYSTDDLERVARALETALEENA